MRRRHGEQLVSCDKQQSFLRRTTAGHGSVASSCAYMERRRRRGIGRGDEGTREPHTTQPLWQRHRPGLDIRENGGVPQRAADVRRGST